MAYGNFCFDIIKKKKYQKGTVDRRLVGVTTFNLNNEYSRIWNNSYYQGKKKNKSYTSLMEKLKSWFF